MTNPAQTLIKNLTSNTTLTPLDSLTLIEVTGDDAQAFLQGQFSNDVDALGDRHDAKRCQLNAYCNPKGRVLAVVRLVRHAGGFWMIVPADLADNLSNRLKMFVLRAKVAIAPKPQVALRGLINADAGNGGGDDNITRVPIAGIVPRQILIGEQPAVDAFARAHTADTQPDDARWRLIDILSGIPQIYPPTVEAFIPQMLNLDLIDGLSFTKGCYPGQEIVARLRYRGQVKQRMLAATAQGIANLAPGDPVYSTQRADQKVGQIVDAVKTGHDQYTFTATAPPATAPPATTPAQPLLPGSPSSPPLTPIALPYSVAVEQSGR